MKYSEKLAEMHVGALVEIVHWAYDFYTPSYKWGLWRKKKRDAEITAKAEKLNEILLEYGTKIAKHTSNQIRLDEKCPSIKDYELKYEFQDTGG